MPPPPTTTKHWFIAWFINISFRCMHLHLSYFIGYKSGDKMIYRSVLIYYHKKKNINCSKANVIHLFRGSLKNTTQDENKINIKHRHWFFFHYSEALWQARMKSFVVGAILCFLPLTFSLYFGDHACVVSLKGYV